MELNSNPIKMVSNSNPNYLFLSQQKQDLQLRREKLNKDQQQLELLEEQQQLQLQQQQEQQLQQQTEREEEDKWRDSLPLGYRFHPTDEELLIYLYLKLYNLPMPEGIIADVNVYEYDPLSLSDMAFESGDEVLYFFTALKRKHPNGMRPNRGTTTGGYWRTTSKPIDITTVHDIHKIMGIKRSLVYMIGKASDKGNKTNWIMHEYTVDDVKPSPSPQPNQWNKYILCSIYYRQARGGDSAELSPLGKRKQPEQQRIEPNSETEAEESVDDHVLNLTKRIRQIEGGSTP